MSKYRVSKSPQPGSQSSNGFKQESRIRNKISTIPNKVGYLAIFIQSIQVTIGSFMSETSSGRTSSKAKQAGVWANYDYFINVQIGNVKKQSAKIKRKSNFVEVNQIFGFSCTQSDKIRIEIFDQARLESIGFTQFPLNKLFNIARVRHCMEIDIINEEKFKNQQTIQKIAVMNIQLLHLNEKIGTLQLGCIQANLERDTESLGKMDPYLVAKVDGVEYKTMVKNEAGKHPIWNCKFLIPINNVETQMEIFIYDKDNINDDLIGSTKLNLLARNFLVPTKKSRKQFQTIYFQNKKAGIINIDSKFILNQL